MHYCYYYYYLGFGGKFSGATRDFMHRDHFWQTQRTIRVLGIESGCDIQGKHLIRCTTFPAPSNEFILFLRLIDLSIYIPYNLCIYKQNT